MHRANVVRRDLVRNRNFLLSAAICGPVACLPLIGSAQTVTSMSTVNIVTPSQATASDPFAAPITQDFENYQVQPLEAPYPTPSNPGADASYLPNVVNSEDGIADQLGGTDAETLAAYEAQAVAVRTYLYFNYGLNAGSYPPPAGSPLISQGFIINSQLNQVYAQVGGNATPTAQGATTLEEEAVENTDGIVLEYGANPKTTTGDYLIDGLFVAGATPTTSDTPFGNASSEPDPTGTQPDVTYNRGLLGTDPSFQKAGLPYADPANPADHGTLSQNGDNFLATNADPTTGDTFNYADILRYFYGADIHMTVVTPSSVSAEIQHPIPVETFATDNGFFGNGDTTSAQNLNVSSVNVSHSTDNPLGSDLYGSQVLQIHSTAAFNYNDVSGLGPNSVQTSSNSPSAALSLLGDAAVNLNMPSIGTISYWVKVTAGTALTTSIELNDDSTGDTYTSLPLTLDSDGEWHEYTFAIDDVPGLSSGLGYDFSVNSINFTGAADTTLELGDLSYSETGAVPEPTTLAAVSLIGLLALRRRRA